MRISKHFFNFFSEKKKINVIFVCFFYFIGSTQAIGIDKKKCMDFEFFFK